MPGQFTLYGMPFSTAASRVQLALDEANFTDYDYVNVNLFKGEHKRPAYIARNPYGKIPTLVTADGTTIYESRAIVKYLARRYPDRFARLIPDLNDPAAMAYFEQCEQAEALYFTEPMTKITNERFIKRIFGRDSDEAVVAREKATLEAHLDVCEKVLGPGHEYMAGKTYGLVDIFYIPYFARMDDCGLGDMVERRPNLKAWWERCKSRPVIAKFLKEQPTVEDYRAKL